MLICNICKEFVLFKFGYVILIICIPKDCYTNYYFSKVSLYIRVTTFSHCQSLFITFHYPTGENTIQTSSEQHNSSNYKYLSNSSREQCQCTVVCFVFRRFGLFSVLQIARCRVDGYLLTFEARQMPNMA